ncbi:MAG: type II toxin-antitoxin system PemK/MazF family toxin, partial [Patescibacteria group bacterium]|nr:type II toxin-antitoxin system PemK/MazF family toxin [Patescibacteria group bacterium]
QDGKGEKFLRPVLILKKLSPNTFVGLPLTLKTRQHRYFLDCHAMDKVRRQVLLSQLITFDIKRLHERMTVVGEDTFTIIRKAVRNLF